MMKCNVCNFNLGNEDLFCPNCLWDNRNVDDNNISDIRKNFFYYTEIEKEILRIENIKTKLISQCEDMSVKKNALQTDINAIQSSLKAQKEELQRKSQILVSTKEKKELEKSSSDLENLAIEENVLKEKLETTNDYIHKKRKCQSGYNRARGNKIHLNKIEEIFTTNIEKKLLNELRKENKV